MKCIIIRGVSAECREVGQNEGKEATYFYLCFSLELLLLSVSSLQVFVETYLTLTSNY